MHICRYSLTKYLEIGIHLGAVLGDCSSSCLQLVEEILPGCGCTSPEVGIRCCDLALEFDELRRARSKLRNSHLACC